MRAHLALVTVLAGTLPPARGAEADAFASRIRPVLEEHCLDCHGAEKPKGDLNLERFAARADLHADAELWVRIARQVDSGEMPPPEKSRLTEAERAAWLSSVRAELAEVARRTAGDPGPVVLRRLSNAEYAHTLRDLTGVDSLDPARTLPVDGAAGEGFANVGDALVMSPALLEKYLESARKVAAHLVPLEDGIAFSPHTSRRDWTNERLDRIRAFHARYTAAEGATEVNLQGVKFSTNDGGRLPVRDYLAATIAARDGRGAKPGVAGLNARYLQTLLDVLRRKDNNPLLSTLRHRWASATGPDVPALAEWVAQWQNALWKFNPVGQIGKTGGPAAWMTPVDPLANRRELRADIPANSGDPIRVRLTATSADPSRPGRVVWEKARLVTAGQADIPLGNPAALADDLARRRALVRSTAAACLAAADAVQSRNESAEAAAKRLAVPLDLLDSWLRLLGIQTGPSELRGHLAARNGSVDGKAAVRGWVGADALGVLANTADTEQRVPGTMASRSVAVHPSPSRAVVVAWQSPANATARVSWRVQDAHTACGNGVVWSVDVRRGATRRALGAGATEAGTPQAGDAETVVNTGDVVALVIGPRDGSHVCDLTAVQLSITAGSRVWDLAADIVPDILAGNPHADAAGTAGIWHFLEEPADRAVLPVLSADALLGRWQNATDPVERARLAGELQTRLSDPARAADAEAALLLRAGGPLVPWPAASAPGTPLAAEFTLPAEVAAGRTLVVDARAGDGASLVSIAVGGSASPAPTPPVLVAGEEERARWTNAFAEFRALFPAALVYAKIVPVDEVITLVQFHREDEHLARLMLGESERAELDRLWGDLRFVSQEALTAVDAYDQLWQFATQDADPKVFEALRQPIRDRAAAFRTASSNAAPRQVEAVIALADRAWRRPLTVAERDGLRATHAALRAEGLEPDEALRLLLARVLVSPAFLYRQERPGAVTGPVNDRELAARLSYFLTSSLPDEPLRADAASGRLRDPAVLLGHARRLREGPHARRLAEEFGLYWLHLADFDRLDEKSPRHFPEFLSLRGPMREEAVRFLADLLQRGAPATELLDADHTFLNGELAAFIGVPGVAGPEWRRVDGMRARGRGGILGLPAVLARQSGASRTSPILRGTWISEVLLGDKLPKPPAGVPVLPEDEAGTDPLTVRQMVERHSSDPACARCHRLVDPYGFSLERFDAIGRLRDRDLAGRAIDTRVTLPGGDAFDGLDGLRAHLMKSRRDDICRAFARKLLGYALGRATRLSDQPLLDEMQRDLAAAGWPVGDIVDRIVTSPQFLNIRGVEPAGPTENSP